MNKIKLIISLSLISVFFLFIKKGFSQTVTEEWVARYAQGISNFGRDIAIDANGNVYVTGDSYLGATSDYLTIKYNSNGILQWVASYNGPGNSEDIARSIAVDANGNVFVTGESNGDGTSKDYATIKYNSNGIEQWVVRYDGGESGIDIAHRIAVDLTGNVYATGRSASIGGIYDFLTIKYNSNGVQQWLARYNSQQHQEAIPYDIAVDVSGNVFVTGHSYGNGTYMDFTTIKYNSTGDEQWVSRYNGPGNGHDDPRSLVIDNNGNVYVTGISRGIGTYFDYATVKYNSNGIEQWVSRYNGWGPYSDDATGIAVDVYGNIYVTGNSVGNGTGLDFATIKYNPDGIEQWVARYNGPGNDYDYAYDMAIDTNGNVYVTGNSYGNGTEGDYATIKYNTHGIEQWVARYNGPANGNDLASSIVVAVSGNVYVTGFSTSSTTIADVTTIKYSQSTGIQNISLEIPDKYSLSQNYPNPFNPSTKINFALPETGFVSLKVFDATGRQITELVNQNLIAGEYEYEFNASNLTTGVYFYTLTAGKFSETKRMILLR